MIKLKQIGGRPTFWKIVINLYFSHKLSYFDDIWRADAHVNSEYIPCVPKKTVVPNFGDNFVKS